MLLYNWSLLTTPGKLNLDLISDKILKKYISIILMDIFTSFKLRFIINFEAMSRQTWYCSGIFSSAIWKWKCQVFIQHTIIHAVLDVGNSYV